MSRGTRHRLPCRCLQCIKLLEFQASSEAEMARDVRLLTPLWPLQDLQMLKGSH